MRLGRRRDAIVAGIVHVAPPRASAAMLQIVSRSTWNLSSAIRETTARLTGCGPAARLHSQDAQNTTP